MELGFISGLPGVVKMEEVSSMGMWWISLAIAGVVVVVVAGLLTWIALVAERIVVAAKGIWDAGKNIAANTVQIWQLGETNHTARQILAGVEGLAAVGSSIEGRVTRLAEKS